MSSASTEAGMPKPSALPNAATACAILKALSPSVASTTSAGGFTVAANAVRLSPTEPSPKLSTAQAISGMSASFFIRLKRNPGVKASPTRISVDHKAQSPARSPTAKEAVSRC